MFFRWAIVAFAIFVNTTASKALAHFGRLALVLHILGPFAILIPLVYLGPHGDVSVFNPFFNAREWPTQGLSFMAGLPAPVFSLVAYLFCPGDPAAALESQLTLGYPSLFAFQCGTGSASSAAVMGLIIVVLGVCPFGYA